MGYWRFKIEGRKPAITVPFSFEIEETITPIHGRRFDEDGSPPWWLVSLGKSLGS